jgi:hypothetical protein
MDVDKAPRVSVTRETDTFVDSRSVLKNRFHKIETAEYFVARGLLSACYAHCCECEFVAFRLFRRSSAVLFDWKNGLC